MKTKKAQILVVTLFVLTILAVTIIGVIIVVRRDTEQVTTNRKREELFGVAENFLRDFVSRYGEETSEITSVYDDYPGLCRQGENVDTIVCDLDSSYSTASPLLDVSTRVEIENVKVFTDNFSMPKDTALDYHLDGYTNSFDIAWEGEASFEFMITYVDNAKGIFNTVVDVYNVSGVLDGPIMNSAADSNGPMNFRNSALGTDANSVKIDFAQIPELTNCGNSCKALVLTITPRMRELGAATNVQIIPSNPENLPYQARRFRTFTSDRTDTSTPVADVETFVSLYPQFNSYWNYALFSIDVNLNFNP